MSILESSVEQTRPAPSTIDELQKLDPDIVVPMHCTGAPFIEAMRRRMPEQLVRSYLGTRITFGV